ncbi:MAG: hypothetical protein MK095_08770 [Phycisphaerales bacterium]|nr:hypothetical protein [Phycisphaerales bacterium]
MSTTNDITQRIDSLEDRLARRESQLRRHRLALVGLAAVAPVALLLAADYTRFQHIQMSKMEIVDEQGKVVLALSGNDAGGQIDVWNADSKNVLRLSANKHGGDVAVWNTNGNSVAGAWATADGGAIATWDDQGARTARIDSADGLGKLALYAGGDTPLLGLIAGENGGALVANHADGMSSIKVEPNEFGSGMDLLITSDDADRGMSLIALESSPGSANIMAGVNAYVGGVMATSDDVNIGSRCGPNTLEMHNGANARLTMQTPSGNIELRSTTDEIDGPALELTNAQGNTVVRNGVRSNGGGLVNVSGPTGETVGMLRSDLDGNGRLDLGDADGNLLITMQSRKEQGPTFAMLSSWGKTLAVLAGTEEGGVLNLMNRNGVPVISTGIARDRRGGTMAIQNERGVTVISAGSDASGSGQLRLQDVDGKARQTLPSTR